MADDTHILDGSPVEITFAGETYQLKQKPRKKQRQVRQALCEVAGVLGSLEDAHSDAAKLPIIMRGVNGIVEFCEEHYPYMGDVEGKAHAAGMDGMKSLIEDVFTPLFDAWVKPYLPSDDEPQKKTETTST